MSKNQSASGLTNFVQYDSYGNIKFVSGSNTLMTVSASGAIITTGTISGSAAANATSASYASNADLLGGLDSTAFAVTAAYSDTSGSLYSTSASLSTASGSFNTRVSALEATGSALSSSILSVSSSAYATSGSLSTASGSFNTRVATIESKYATTGSNNFRAPQYVSDTTVPTGFANTTGSIYTDGGLQVTKDAYFSSSMYIKGNLTIYGTQSVAYITSSQLNIATNLITVNTATPAVRFGGLAVYDSGSTGTGMTGSLLWDSQNNSWIYDNPSGSGNYDSAMVIMGPRNASALGSEQGLTCNYLVQGHGHHHTTSSGIFHDGTNTCIPNNLIANGCINIGATSTSLGSLISIQSANDQAGITMYNSYACNKWSLRPGTPGVSNNGFAIQDDICSAVRIQIDSSGKVGICTTSPEHLLHVKGDCASTIATVAQFQNVNCTAGNKSFIRVRGQYNVGSSYSAYFGMGQDSNLYIYGNDPSRAGDIVVTAAGLVGINTCTPTYRLDINGKGQFTSDADCQALRLVNGTISGGSTSGVTGLYLGDAGSGVNMIQREKQTANTAAIVLYSEYGYSIQSKVASFNYSGTTLYTAGTARISIDGNGCVGINCTTPSYTFDVNGAGRYTVSSGDTLILSKGTGPNILFQKTNATAQCWSMGGDPNFRLYDANAAFYPLTVTAGTGLVTFACQVQTNGSCIIINRGDGNPAVLQLGNTSNGYQIQYTCTGGQRLAFVNGAPSEYASFYGTGVACFAGRICAPSLYVIDNVLANTQCNFGIITAGAPSGGAIAMGIVGRPSDDYSLITFRKNDGLTTLLEVGGNSTGLIFNNYVNAPTSFSTNSVNRLTIGNTGIITATCRICTPQIVASDRIGTLTTQIYDSSIGLGNNTVRTVVICGGIYSLADFHLMIYGGAGTGMAALRLSIGGYFANTNLLQFCELQRYAFNLSCISPVTNNGSSLSFNIAYCGGTYGSGGVYRMISTNADSNNSCVQVYII